MPLLRRLMPGCWFTNDNSTAGTQPPKRTQPSVKKRVSLRKTENGNKLAVDMHEDTSATSNEIEIDSDDAVEIIKLSERQKEILKTTWTTIYAELGQTLCYVGKREEAQKASVGVEETFLRLFEEYPMSQQFFGDFRGTPVEALRNDARLSNALQEHAVRVLRVVEKVIGRLEDLEKSKNYLLKLGRFHRHAGIPSDYLGVMGAIFVHAVKPYMEKNGQWNEDTEDAWMELFGHITRVMTHAHVHYTPDNRKNSDGE